MFLKSIRFKITILYMAILALTLTSFSLILYHNVNVSLNSNMDTLLKSKAGGIAQAIDTYWQAANLEAMDGADASEILRKRRNANFSRIAQRWVKEESTDPKLLDIMVQVFDTDGKAIASSKNIAGLGEIPRGEFIPVLQGKQRFDTMADFRIYTAPVFENEKVAYIVQVASPLGSIKIALNNLKVGLFLLFPITVLTTGVMGAFLAKVTLHPVDNMIETIHQIRAENMMIKLKIPNTKDEIQKLAETFNDMLGRLESAFNTQRRLFADLSHELKTPLTILKGEFEVILKKTRSNVEYQETLKSALEETDRIISLAENLLILAKFDSKEISQKSEKLDITVLLKGITNNVRGLAELKEIMLSFSGLEGLWIYGDPNQLKILFLNIIENAFKYTPEKGRIEVSAVKRNASANISIKDTGPGIPEDEIGHIFDRFYRVDKSRSSSGFGLGLSIAKAVAESHGGGISVQSHPGEGTTFIVSLPLVRP
ncbi:MAG: ATP-binding protein [Candidatus Omnitrophica bacterium]|nr:ATP-binding protein [Candidatus Omnitrophota bacterium]